MSEGAEMRELLLGWLEQAASTAKASDEDMSLALVSGAQLRVLALDLEGMVEGADRVKAGITALLLDPPSADAFETRLVDVEIDLRHALWHWKSIEEVLAGLGLWTRDLDDDET